MSIQATPPIHVRAYLQLTSFNLQRPDLQSLKFWNRRWSLWLIWKASYHPACEGKLPKFYVGRLVLGTFGLRARFPWIWEATVWLVGVNRTEDVMYSHMRQETKNWRLL